MKFFCYMIPTRDKKEQLRFKMSDLSKKDIY